MNVWAFKCGCAVYVSVLVACLGCCRMLFTMSGFDLAEGRGDVTQLNMHAVAAWFRVCLEPV